jgi:phage antirepressor YoqD-like protein
VIEQESEQHNQIISELEPKARYCDLVLKSKTLCPSA